VLSSKSCQGELYLNGYRLADFGAGDYYLGAGAVRALRQGVNVLAIHVENPYDGIISVDFALKSASDLKLPEGPVPMPGLEGLTP
jgi:lysine/ornithine N-monooxygenase